LTIPIAEGSSALNVLPPSFKRRYSSPDFVHRMQRALHALIKGDPTTGTVIIHSSSQSIPPSNAAYVAPIDYIGNQQKRHTKETSHQQSPQFATVTCGERSPWPFPTSKRKLFAISHSRTADAMPNQQGRSREILLGITASWLPFCSWKSPVDVASHTKA
jgi:hypothetical protein